MSKKLIVGGAALLLIAAFGAVSTEPSQAQSADPSASGFQTLEAPPPADAAATRKVRRKKKVEEPVEAVGGVAGRYAVMREKRDTGCMLTLDSARVAGGARAQLAPGCRDQGIVVFDPIAWQIIKGDLVLTAKAGHKARLAKEGVDGWAKDPKDGGKPLGLKKL